VELWLLVMRGAVEGKDLGLYSKTGNYWDETSSRLKGLVLYLEKSDDPWGLAHDDGAACEKSFSRLVSRCRENRHS